MALIEYRVSKVVFGVLFIYATLNLIAADVNQRNVISNQNRRRASDPVSNLFSELGDLILDADRAFAIQTEPKVRHEENLVSQIFRPTSDYFNRIQRNYRDMQKRLGKLIGNTLGQRNTYSESELSAVSPPQAYENEAPTSTSAPFKIKADYNPFAEADKEKHSQNQKSSSVVDDQCSNEILTDPILEHRRKQRCARVLAEEQTRNQIKEMLLDSRQASEMLLQMGSKAIDLLPKDIIRRREDKLKPEKDKRSLDLEKSAERDECSNEVLADPVLENLRKQKCARIVAEEQTRKQIKDLLLDSKRASDAFLQIGSKAFELLPEDIIRRQGEIGISENAEKDGRIIGDVLYSESLFDRNIRQLLKDHGQWILENPLLAGLRRRPVSSTETPSDTAESSEATETATVESTTDATTELETEASIRTTTEHHPVVSKSGESLPESVPIKSSNYYRIVSDDGEIVEEEVDVVIKPHPATSEDITVVEETEQEPKDTVILAFTLDGVPLRLRMGPEIYDPLPYLHKILKSAGVSLNVPVESYDDLEPVGKEVLRLGSGILTRAVNIDVSNSNELKSFVKKLMKSKASGKTRL